MGPSEMGRMETIARAISCNKSTIYDKKRSTFCMLLYHTMGLTNLYMTSSHLHPLLFRFDRLCLSKVHGWSLWFTRILDLVSSFPKVHRWSLWFALCNMFSPQPTNLKVLASPS
ncbi:hypothetical protein Hanom_Chr02g00107861 [Helianthus anomalus]